MTTVLIEVWFNFQANFSQNKVSLTSFTWSGVLKVDSQKSNNLQWLWCSFYHFLIYVPHQENIWDNPKCNKERLEKLCIDSQISAQNKHVQLTSNRELNNCSKTLGGTGWEKLLYQLAKKKKLKKQIMGLNTMTGCSLICHF